MDTDDEIICVYLALKKLKNLNNVKTLFTVRLFYLNIFGLIDLFFVTYFSYIILPEIIFTSKLHKIVQIALSPKVTHF